MDASAIGARPDGGRLDFRRRPVGYAGGSEAQGQQAVNGDPKNNAQDCFVSLNLTVSHDPRLVSGAEPDQQDQNGERGSGSVQGSSHSQPPAEPRTATMDDVLPLAIEWSLCFASFFLTPGLVCLLYGASPSYHVPPPNSTDAMMGTTPKPKFVRKAIGIGDVLRVTRSTYDEPHKTDYQDDWDAYDDFSPFSSVEMSAEQEAGMRGMLTIGIICTVIGAIFLGLMILFCVLRRKRKRAAPPTPQRVSVEPNDGGDNADNKSVASRQ